MLIPRPQLIPTAGQVREFLRETGALREGHFEFPNGQHSEHYFQMPLAMRYHGNARVLNVALARLLRREPEVRAALPHCAIVAPAAGGVPVAFGIREALSADQIFWAEKDDGRYYFRQYLDVRGVKCILVDDIVRSGKVIHFMLDLIREKKWKPKAIGGLTMGADPIVAAVAVHSAQSIVTRSPARSKPLDFPDEFYIHGFLVRKKEKTHGTGQRIEGFRRPGSRVVIVDDVCTTGASTIEAIQAAREFGFEVVAVLCLVEREEAGGRAAVEKAAAPAEFVSLFTAAEIRAEHEKLPR